MATSIARRQFMFVLSGVAAGRPLSAHAQQSKVRLIGVLLLGNADAESSGRSCATACESLAMSRGSINFKFLSAGGKFDLLPKLAAELVALRVDVIVALYTPCALAAQQATREIPVVVVSGDPVGTGLVTSLNRPGGNITGVSLMAAELHGKCVELFRDMLPSVRRVAVLLNAEDPFWQQVQQQVQLAGRAAGIEIAPSVKVRGPNEIDAAFAAMKKDEAGAVVVHGSYRPNTSPNWRSSTACQRQLKRGRFAEVGGLMSYGADGPDVFRQTALFVTKIFQGGDPANMPVEQPTRFELVVNLTTAKALGITIPESFLVRADEVIE